MTDYVQRSYHNLENGKRKEAIGVVITLPQKFEHILDEIHVTFVGKEFLEGRR